MDINSVFLGLISYISAMDLLNRALLRLDGKDGLDLLQKLGTQDLLDGIATHYSLLLTPQGRYLFDFFVINTNGTLYVDIAAHRADDFITTINKYKLRSELDITRILPASVEITLQQPESADGALAVYVDPRHPDLGWRIWRPIERFSDLDVPHDYKKILTERDIIEPSYEMTPGEDLPLEFGLHNAHAISFTKGCFLGQELTSRTHHKHLIKHRIMHVSADHVMAAKTPAHDIQGNVIGEVVRATPPLALLRVKMECNTSSGIVIEGRTVAAA
jgi:tRNA-modifying protein YgfZ